MNNRLKTRASKPGRRADPNSRRAIAERLTLELGFRVTQKAVREWQAKGFPLDHVKALRRELATIQRPPGEDNVPEAASLREQILRAELRRKLASADRLEMEAAKIRGELVEVAGIETEGLALGLAFRQTLDRLASALPPVLAGRPAAEIHRTLKAEFRLALQRLADTPSQAFLTNLTENEKRFC
jgi:hypothetical protein